MAPPHEDIMSQPQSYSTTSSKGISTVTTMADESSPLLPGTVQEASRKAHSVFRYRLFRTRTSILIAILLSVALTSFGDQLQETPSTRILESIICYRHFEEADPSKIKLPHHVIGPGALGGVDEMFCKVDAVQDQLAMLDGFSAFLDGIPALVLAVPFGWAADRYGRWPFLFLNLVQFALRVAWVQIVTWNWQVFDVTAIWYQSVFSLLGGGNAVAIALFYTAVSDVVSEKDRAAAFLRLGAASMSAYLFMPPLAAVLMKKSPWIPSFFGLGLMSLAAVLFLFVPETREYAMANRLPSAPPAEESVTSPEATNAISDHIMLAWHKFKRVMAFLTRDWRVPALIAPFVLHVVLASSTRLVLQYLSKRYTLTFSSATLLITVRNAGQVLILILILPYISKLVMTRFGLSSQEKDITLARWSQIMVVIGLFGLAASTNVPTAALSLAVASIGTGTMFLVRSFLITIVPVHEVARTYSVISIVDTLGLMFGAPLLAKAFGRGLELGGSWIALPFWWLAALSTFFAGVLFVVHLRKGEGEDAIHTEDEAQ